VALAHGARPGLDLCLAPVDVPRVPAAVFEGLARAWEEAGAPARGWLAPAWAAPGGGPGRHGHPVVVGRGLLDRLDDPGLRGRPLKALRALAGPLLALLGPWPEILEDLDTPADLERLQKKLRAPFDS
jgi:CTP:molybdopterin cytidylyltransferase MocA